MEELVSHWLERQCNPEVASSNPAMLQTFTSGSRVFNQVPRGGASLPTYDVKVIEMDSKLLRKGAKLAWFATMVLKDLGSIDSRYLRYKGNYELNHLLVKWFHRKSKQKSNKKRMHDDIFQSEMQ